MPPGGLDWGGMTPETLHTVMSIRPYLPTVPQVSREVLALLLATVAVAWVVSRVPALRTLVRENSLHN